MLLVAVLVAAAPAIAAAATGAVDTAVVGSSVHEARVAAPSDLLTAAAGDKGYYHTHKTKGGDGYKHFDSFHKKDGDSFGYEKHSAYGKGDKGDDGGEYHESSSYSSDDGKKGGQQAQPKVWHYESRTGTQSDPNYDPETYEGDYSQQAPRVAAHPDVEVVGPVSAQRYQVLRDASRDFRGGARGARGRRTDPQAAGTEEDAEYDYYEGEGSSEGDDGGSYYEGGEYEGEGGGDYEGGEGDYY